MNEEKLKAILEAMEGITYLDWMKLRMSINEYFTGEASKQNNNIPLTSTDQIVREYRHYSSTI